LEYLLTDTTPTADILILQETNLRERHIRRMEIPAGWAAVYTNRPFDGQRTGVGVLTLLRRGILLGPTTTVEPIYDVSDALMDVLAIKVRDSIYVNVYIRVMGSRRPEDVLDVFLDHLTSITEGRANLPTVIGGDFNCPRNTELLLELMNSIGFLPVYDRSGRPSPTHACGGTLDWVFIRGDLTASSLQAEIRADDHAVLRTTIQVHLAKEVSQLPTKYRWRVLEELDADQRNEFFQARDRIAAQATSLTDFKAGLTALLQNKLGKVKPPGTGLPRRWLTPKVNQTRRAYKKANSRYRSRPTPERQQAMRQARGDYMRAIRQRKRTAVAQLASQVDLGHSSIHRLVGSIKKDPKHQSRLVPDLTRVLEFWSDQFSDPDALDSELLGHDLLMNFSAEDVATALGQLDPKKATGEDDIRPALFQEPSAAFLKDLARLYTNEAHTASPLPDWMKTGNATILYKRKGPKADPGNYRVIIINSLLAKLYEKMLENHGRSLIAQGKLTISVEQGGFMPNRSTHDSLFILESLRDAQISKGRKLYAAFLDMRKAFDSVNHKRMIALLRRKGAPEAWISQLIKMLAGRKMKLFDALVSLEVGTAQGSPISPLLFILFINPLIERLRACEGIRLTKLTGVLMRCLLFADDIGLLAESAEDLQHMLDVCHEWAQDFRMAFNPNKCELIQLAGSIPTEMPVCRLGGQVLKWVKEVKYLGVPIVQGRRRKLHAPLPKMWQIYHCIRDGLSSSLPVSLRHQLLLIQSNILSIALYPSAVRDMHYGEIDRFVNKCLCRIVGCPPRWTSATFLRAELGVYSSEYYAHRRALSHLWHLHNRAWFRNHLGNLRGTGPLVRLEELAKVYNLDTADIRDVCKETWKARVKRAVVDRAENAMNTALTTKGLPVEVQPRLKRRPYVEHGGPRARAGLLLRWELLHEHHMNRQLAEARPSLPGLLQKIMTGPLPATTDALRKRTLRKMIKELSGMDITASELPDATKPHVKAAITSLDWPNMTSETLRDLLTVVDRVIRWERRRQASPLREPDPAPDRFMRDDHQEAGSSPPTPASVGEPDPAPHRFMRDDHQEAGSSPPTPASAG
jgi:hypothetical protein